MAGIQLNRTHRALIGIVVLGAVVIAAIGFAGSYAAVRELAEEKGFGKFALFFPIGIDAGILVLLALDLLLTWIRIPFPLLRQSAWLLTAATIAFNGATAWPDPLGVGMHAIIPILFVVSIEAARHAIGRIADITADKYMEGVRISRWLLAFPSTFKLWRRMKLWELRSYDEVIRLEQDRLVYKARLRARYGRAWRRKAPIEAVMPLKLARYGVPLAQTAPQGLAAAGIKTPAPQLEVTREARVPEPRRTQEHQRVAEPVAYAEPVAFAEYPEPVAYQEPVAYAEDPEAYDPVPVDAVAAAGRRALSNGGRVNGNRPTVPQFMAPPPLPEPEPEPRYEPRYEPPSYEELSDEDGGDIRGSLPEDVPIEDAYYGAFLNCLGEKGDFPTARQFALYLQDHYGVSNAAGGPLSETMLRDHVREFRQRYRLETQ
ncbi:hypothetical protein SRB5_58860 [Streptomyces sp. RB5]|uniref:DUF2637 domain-containing protein n=1 Tax=Streptomyces smaragdinus TaxID=2585196 RepID=A0A7K0CQD1_9ACTN|nr:DUF2637 domain-containing protein [Streptomyces smaragdinus]MQY15698.1 hypothetical protein [Streptomyces smaragdinus]